MSVLIKMVMPQNCRECRFIETVHRLDERERYICIAHLNEITNLKERLDTCPLVELPDHGDLIDRDVVADALDLMAVYGRLRDAFDMVMSCEAVIPAERSEECG